MSWRLALLTVAALAGCALAPPATGPAALAQPARSGFEDMGAAVQAMQRDDGANPAMLWVEGGRQLWAQAPASPWAYGS